MKPYVSKEESLSNIPFSSMRIGSLFGVEFVCVCRKIIIVPDAQDGMLAEFNCPACGRRIKMEVDVEVTVEEIKV